MRCAGNVAGSHVRVRLLSSTLAGFRMADAAQLRTYVTIAKLTGIKRGTKNRNPMHLTAVRRRIPQPIKLAFLQVQDAVDFILMRRDPLIPPRRLNFVGAGDFKTVGEEFFRYFVDLGGLKPTDSVLDVGCGIGRMAVPLTRYLNDSGRYEGFDIVARGIAWCNANIAGRFPAFHFTHSNVFNGNYNPGGTIPASEYVFPYASRSFDFVFLTSVFTHMLPSDLEHYLSEISRVTKPGGRCLLTFFVLNKESLALIAAGRSTQDFRHAVENWRTTNPNNPEWAVAYPEEFARNLLSKHGWSISEPLHYGSWCGRAQYLSYQDIIIATRK